MPTEGVHVDPSTGKKTFIPLENNPAVFTSLIHDLGVSPQLTFHDVYSLDDPSLLALVPRPALALIFITPPESYYAVRGADGTRVVKPHDALTYDKAGDEQPVTWFLQTIGNACGLMALLHCVANGPVKGFVGAGSPLGRLLGEAVRLGPEARARLLHDSEELEAAHMRAARTGDTAAPAAEEYTPYHFIAFVRGDDGHLWELEGGTDGPVDRGLLEEGEDMLSENALNQGVRRFIGAAGEERFSIVALAKGKEGV